MQHRPVTKHLLHPLQQSSRSEEPRTHTNPILGGWVVCSTSHMCIVNLQGEQYMHGTCDSNASPCLYVHYVQYKCLSMSLYIVGATRAVDANT